MSARTPPAAGSRRWMVVATGSALVGATLVAILAFGRTRAPSATTSPVPPASSMSPAAAGVMPVPPGSTDPLLPGFTDPVTVAETPPSPTPFPSASVSTAAPRLLPPVAPKKNPLSVSVK